MSYTAIVTPITTRPHPNADRLKLGTVAGGHQVVVGLDTQDGQLGIFFPTDGALSKAFCLANNLYTRSALDKLGVSYDPEGPFGFFDTSGRVRAQNFRGERSDGFWLPLSSLVTFGDPSTLRAGDQLTEFNGHPICEKLETHATKQAGAKNRKGKKGTLAMFPKQIDTAQFRFYRDSIPQDARIIITEKLHGTSGRYGYILDELPPTRWQRIIDTLLCRVVERRAWRYVHGSRNVVLDSTSGDGWYGTNAFRYDAVGDLQLRKGEVLFYEIVGWAGSWYAGTLMPIMPPQPINKKELPLLAVAYGDQMHYTYGCPQGTCKMYVYRIVQHTPEGIPIELSWDQVVGRCRELGVEHVPVLDDWKAHDIGYPLSTIVENLISGPSTLDSHHIREGVVVRVEIPGSTNFYKEKSHDFKVLEGIIKLDANYVDPEEAA